LILDCSADDGSAAPELFLLRLPLLLLLPTRCCSTAVLHISRRQKRLKMWQSNYFNMWQNSAEPTTRDRRLQQQ